MVFLLPTVEGGHNYCIAKDELSEDVDQDEERSELCGINRKLESLNRIRHLILKFQALLAWHLYQVVEYYSKKKLALL